MSTFRKCLFILFLLCIPGITELIAQSAFTITYNFDNTGGAVATAGVEAVIGDSAVAGGTKLGTTSYVTDGSVTGWRGEIIKNNNLNFINTFLYVPLYAKAGYSIRVESVHVKQRSSITGANNYFRIGASLNGAVPVSGEYVGGTFSSSYTDAYYTLATPLSVSGMNYVTVWLAGRGNTVDTFYWDVDEITITGTYEPATVDYAVEVSDDTRQTIRLGVDCAALWYWRSNLKNELAQVAVGEMDPSYVRVKINTAYEREQGVKADSVYDSTLELMTAMRNANSGIDFFASPSTMSEAYTNEEKTAIFGHVNNVPFSCYPIWILEWIQNGTKTMSDGTVVPVWERGNFNYQALPQYYADYLNFMYQQGFDVRYLDMSNEQSVITPAITRYIRNNLPSKLLPGVQVPDFIVPSTWNVQGGIDWLDSVDLAQDEDQAFQIAAVHNTGENGSETEFASKAAALGKEAWNTELHDWTGLTLQDDIMNSEVFWTYLRSGFSGIETWLFFGDMGGKPHSMIWTQWNRTTIIKTGKYEIFKQVVNHANEGNYVDISMPYPATPTAAFIKDNVLSVWILNKTLVGMPNTAFNLTNRSVLGKTVEVVKWNKDLPAAGSTFSFVNTRTDQFIYDIDPQSLYFFRIDLGDTNSIVPNVMGKIDFKVYHQPANEEVIIRTDVAVNTTQGDYFIYDLGGQCLKSGMLTGTRTIVNAPDLSSGVYVVEIRSEYKSSFKKLVVGSR